MGKIKESIKTKKQSILKKQRQTRAKRYHAKGGAGNFVKEWQYMPEFSAVNKENEAMLQLSSAFNDKQQHTLYYSELANLFEYKGFEINMDFISNFYRHIYYDIEEKYAIDLIKKQWRNDSSKIKYNITNFHVNPTHGNTTIVFLKSKTDETKKKVIKIFNNIPCNIAELREFLSLEISHISPKSRNALNQYNYMHYNKLNDFGYKDSLYNTFNMFNFNHKKYYVPEVSEKNTFLSISCRNSDPINEYIINLIIGYINTTLSDTDKIRYVHYDNLFVTNIYSDAYPKGKLCWCLLMDMVDGSLDSLLLKEDAATLSDDTMLDYLTQAEKLMMPLKTADYLFTHTDMKLENLFYKKNGDQVELYLADLDKSSITFKGIRFYNDIRENPNIRILGVSTDPVQGYSAVFKGDEYLKKTYNDRKYKADSNQSYEYRISRLFRVNPIPGAAGTEYEAFYMRYNNQPFYTSFDMVTLWLSFLHFRKGDKKTNAIIDFTRIKGLNSDSGLKLILSKYMTADTINLLVDFYKGLSTNYNGNFGLLLKPIYDREQSQLDKIKFLHQYNSDEQPKLIRGLYLTLNNKIALSLPFAPTSIPVKDNITSFKPEQDKTRELFFYKKSSTPYIKEFIAALNKENILTTAYSGDYSIAAERGSIIQGFGRLKPPAYIIKTNRYSSLSYIYEWDYMVKEPSLDKKEQYTENDIVVLIKLFTRLSTSTYPRGNSVSN